MLELNILGLYLRVARKVRTVLGAVTTMRPRRRPRELRKPLSEADPAWPAADREERELAMPRGTALGSSCEAALRRRAPRTSSELENAHRKSRRRARRSVATSTEAISDADRTQRAAEAQTADYIRRLAANEAASRS